MEVLNVLDIAGYVKRRYAKENNNCAIEDIKLHKLMYFAQREMLLRYDVLLFDADFYAWKFGPVLHEICEVVKAGKTIADCGLQQFPIQMRFAVNEVMDYVFKQYSKKSSYSLSRLTRGQVSWKNARKGISDYAESDVLMRLEDIRYDARQQLDRRNMLRKRGLL